MRKVNLILMTVVSLVIFSVTTVQAVVVPENDSQAEYFYVFGAQGDSLMGAEDNELTLYIDVPAADSNDVVISVYDPDTGGRKDWRVDSKNAWDTTTEFSVYGNDLLDSQTFSEGEYNQRYFQFGPYSKKDGEKMGDNYRFKLIAEGLDGDDANLFKVKVSPRSASVFSDNVTFRLLSDEGDEMYFYPQVSSDTTKIIAENFDLDRFGGKSVLIDESTRQKFDVNDSLSGQWNTTTIKLGNPKEQRLVYKVTKISQRSGNAGIRFKDQNGKLLPIYFQRGSRPESVKTVRTFTPAKKPEASTKCNTFTFDARGSYDQEKQDLDYFWDFGDGNTSSEPYLSHTYESGDYTVKLTVSDNSGLQCDSSTSTQSLSVNTPPDADFASKMLACTGESIKFDAGNTVDNTLDQVSYKWNFGDGKTGTGKVVSKSYDRGGMYKVLLRVDDNANTTCSQDSVEKLIQINSPPVADAGNDISLCLKSSDEPYTVVFDGRKSKDADGDKLIYAWDFGDGSKGQGSQTSHVYKQGGSYQAKLTLNDTTNTQCSVASDSINVTLNRSPLADSGEDKSVCVNQRVTFDGSKSSSDPSDTLDYAWDFGDGENASGIRAAHSYDKGGRYLVSLLVANGNKNECSSDTDFHYVNVNARPNVSINAVESSCVGDLVTFDASGTNDPDGDRLKYVWNFGDGTVVEGGPKISHKYAKGGSYNVSVSVDDQRGFDCSLASASVRVKVNTPPVANAGPNVACCVDQSTPFDGSSSTDSDGDTLSYSWSFGDNQTSSDSRVNHVYKKSGLYQVFLRVDDNSGTSCSSDVSGFKANVNTKPVSVIKIK